MLFGVISSDSDNNASHETNEVFMRGCAFPIRQLTIACSRRFGHYRSLRAAEAWR